MRAILHMGPGKTGTSSIQQWLLEHHAALNDAGILFSANGCAPTGNSGMIAAALIGPRGDEPDDVGQVKFSGLKEDLAASDADTLIISAEGFYNRLLYADAGITADMATDQVLGHIRSIKAKLADLGVTSITAAFVMRNEADRTVSRIVQEFHGAQIDPDVHDLPPKNVGLAKPHDYLFKTLTDEGFTVQAILFKDPDDTRSILERLWDKVGIADRIAHVPMNIGRYNVSFGTIGCLSSSIVCKAIDRHLPEDGDMNWRAKGRSKGSLRSAYEAFVSPDMDEPFNGNGPERTAKVQEAQADVIANLGPWLSPRECAELAKTKWSGVPMSPLRVDDLDQDGRNLIGNILHRYVELMKQNARTLQIVGTDVLDDVSRTAASLERELA